VLGQANKMRKSLRTTRSGQIQRSQRIGTRRRSHTAGTSGHPPRSLSRSQKERIWHNWLMEENYLG